MLWLLEATLSCCYGPPHGMTLLCCYVTKRLLTNQGMLSQVEGCGFLCAAWHKGAIYYNIVLLRVAPRLTSVWHGRATCHCVAYTESLLQPSYILVCTCGQWATVPRLLHQT